MVSAYPILFVLAGFAASTLFYRQAVSIMPAQAKGAPVDASSRTNMLSLLVIALFVALLLWRPLFGWIFLACAYVCLGARSVLRLRGLNLPARAGRWVLVGNWAAVVSIVLCALIFARRALR